MKRSFLRKAGVAGLPLEGSDCFEVFAEVLDDGFFILRGKPLEVLLDDKLDLVGSLRNLRLRSVFLFRRILLFQLLDLFGHRARGHEH